MVKVLALEVVLNDVGGPAHALLAELRHSSRRRSR